MKRGAPLERRTPLQRTAMKRAGAERDGWIVRGETA